MEWAGRSESSNEYRALGRRKHSFVSHLVHITDFLHAKLDPIHYSTAVLGEEQFFDVELDRHTEFLPEIAEGTLPDWTVEGDEDFGKIGDNAINEEEPGMSLRLFGHSPVALPRSDPNVISAIDYVVKLRSLLPRFPMTAKGTRSTDDVKKNDILIIYLVYRLKLSLDLVGLRTART